MTRRKLMSLLAAAAALFAVESQAAPIKISGTHGRGEIKATCERNGGNYTSNLEGYACVKPNCDGAGGTCGVRCENNGQCTGHLPRTVKSPARSVTGVLGNYGR